MLPRAALLTLLALPVLAQPPLSELGRSHKLRILVDKVMQPEADWVTEEWMVAETAEMGFNVFSPRMGHEDLDAVEQVTRWCEGHGLYHMPWMRGSLTAPGGPEADGRRMVWDSGEESPLWSPCSDEFWEWTTRYVVAYAEMSTRRPGLIGVFVDYENYAAGGPGMLYELSYDESILGRFAEEQGVDIPDLPPDERRDWLEAEGLHGAFEAFQQEHWRQRCIELRRRVDAHNPAFLFCIYPAPGSPFMIEGCYEWATDAAPLILADAVTYGRPGRFAPQDESLETNRTRLAQRREVAEAAGIHYLYAGGIDPVVQGADPEFCGKNAVAISDVTDGYWVFYEGPTYHGTHPEHRRWFTWANRAIQAGELAAWREPRETPVDLALDWIDRMGWQGLAPLDPEAAGGDLPPVSLRGRHLLLLGARPGEPLSVTLAYDQVGSYDEKVVWDLRDSSGAPLETGLIEAGESATIEVPEPEPGVYALGVDAGACAAVVTESTGPIAVSADGGVHPIGGAERLFFHVPEGKDSVTLRAQGQRGETVRVLVRDPAGEIVADGQTTPTLESVEMTVATEGRSGTWSVELTRADEGALEDATLWLDPSLPRAVSLLASHVFGAGL